MCSEAPASTASFFMPPRTVGIETFHPRCTDKRNVFHSDTPIFMAPYAGFERSINHKLKPNGEK